MQLVTAAQMRDMDCRTITDVGLSGAVLMERAAIGAVDALLDAFEVVNPTRIGLVCGGGNNGGDGFAMARLLADRGHDVCVVTLKSADAYQGDAETNLRILERLNLQVEDMSALSADDLLAALESISPCTIWVDAIFGTGLDRDVEGAAGAAIEFLNSHTRVFAVDIPSGISADTGRALGIAVRATATATFGAPKLGHALYPGRDHCGVVTCVDIGIPASVFADVGWQATWLVDPPWVQERATTTHKGQAGRVVILGGEGGEDGRGADGGEVGPAQRRRSRRNRHVRRRRRTSRPGRSRSNGIGCPRAHD